MRRKREWMAALRGLLLPAAILAVLLVFFTAVDRLERDRETTDQSRL